MATQITDPGRSWMTPSGVVLILANLAPLAGVFVFDWSVFEILLLFWAENVIVGVLNLFRMLLASGPGSGNVSGQLFVAGFFSVHYGLFTFAHGVFLLFLFGPALPTLPGYFGDLQAIRQVFLSANLELPLFVLASSHLFSFFWNYVGRHEYKNVTPMKLMARPYGRVIVLHITIIVGGFLVSFLGSPVVGLFTLVLIKIALDLAAHRKEHLVKLKGSRAESGELMSALQRRSRQTPPDKSGARDPGEQP